VALINSAPEFAPVLELAFFFLLLVSESLLEELELEPLSESDELDPLEI